MAAIICPHCGKYVSSLLSTCTECGNALHDSEEEATPIEPELSTSQEQDVDVSPAEDGSQIVEPAVIVVENIPAVDDEAEDVEEAQHDLTKLSNSELLDKVSQNETESSPKTLWKKLSARRIITGILLLLIISGVTWFFITDHNRDVALEQRAFERLDGCADLLWYEDYIVRFPNGEHIDTVKKMYEKAKVEQQQFYSETVGGDKAALLAFIKAHPNSPYCKVCENRIDSLDWYDAALDNTVQSYQNYLIAHPEGIFAKQATEGKARQFKLEVTDEERSMLSGTVHNFLSAMTNADAARIDAMINSTMNFCGQADATGDNVIQFYTSNFHRDDILGVHFAIDGSLNIKKQESRQSSNQYDYSITAKLDATLNRSATDSLSTQVWEMSAKLTPDRKFTSINIYR